MSDAAIKNAAERRDALAQKINHLNQELEDARRDLAEVDQFIGLWERFSGEKPPVAAIGTPKPALVIRYRPTPKPKPANPPKEQIGDVVEKFLRDRGLPATRKMIAKHLKDENIIIHGTNPDMVLSTMLWRMQERFRRLPPHGYWLTNEPDPDGLDLV